jgi:hypothetical protein
VALGPALPHWGGLSFLVWNDVFSMEQNIDYVVFKLLCPGRNVTSLLYPTLAGPYWAPG